MNRKPNVLTLVATSLLFTFASAQSTLAAEPPCVAGSYLLVEGPDLVTGKPSGWTLPNGSLAYSPQYLSVDFMVCPAKIGFAHLVSKGDGISAASDRSFDVFLLDDGRVKVEVCLGPIGNSYVVPIISQSKLGPGKWRRVTVAVVVAFGFFNGRIFIDGQIDSTVIMDLLDSLGNTSIRLTQRPLTVGCNENLPQSTFHGAIDELSVWNAVMTDSVYAHIHPDSHWSSKVVHATFDGHAANLVGTQAGTLIGTGRLTGGCARAMSYGASSGSPPPIVTLDAAPVQNSSRILTVSNPTGLPAVVMLVLGLEPTRAPAFGGELWTKPLSTSSFVMYGASISAPVVVPGDAALVGFPVFLQSFVPMASAQKGVGMSRGLALEIGTP